ncbi:MAG: hypothetical protein JNL69_10350 [Bacteroidia bacterium]|nr:hypothetical protein [Bacteroidia bacterium]
MQATTKANLSVVKKHTGHFLDALLYENGIIEIVWNTSIEIIEVEHLTQMQQAICDLGNGKKIPVFFTAHDFLQLSKEGAAYAASEQGVAYTLANAVLIDSLAKKLLFNFFLNFNKPIAPTKGFSSREEAFNWLEGIKESENTF